MSTKGCVGIWWFFNSGEVNGYKCSLDLGVSDNGLISYVPMICDWDLLSKYDNVEHGKVIYDIRSQVYMIVCSVEVAKDKKSIEDISKAFKISNLRYNIICNDYRVGGFVLTN